MEKASAIEHWQDGKVILHLHLMNTFVVNLACSCGNSALYTPSLLRLRMHCSRNGRMEDFRFSVRTILTILMHIISNQYTLLRSQTEPESCLYLSFV